MNRSKTGLIFACIMGAIIFTCPRAWADDHSEVRGMTISCATWGWEWGTDEMVATMAELADMGVNWITIHPYAQIMGNGRVSDRFWREDPRPEWLSRPIREAHRLGLKIFIKPHLAYWGSPFHWRGEIAFTTEEEWARFFESYEEWILYVVRACEGADGFAVGTELDRTVRFEDEWRQIIARIRDDSDVPITYAANWSEFRDVPFWDALDVVGIQAYFPVADSLGMPNRKELDIAWDRIAEDVSTFVDSIGKKVLLTELGYNRSATAAVQPWDYRVGGDGAEEIQVRCLDAALRALERKDLLAGAFLWKWFPGSQGGRNFIMSTPAMREVIQAYWK